MLSGADDLALAILGRPLELVTAPAERAYWLYLAVSFALGLAVCLARTRSLGPALKALSTPQIWWHRSAKMDYRLIILNAAIQAVLLAPFVLSALAVAQFTVDLGARAFGEPDPSSLSPAAVVALYTVVLFAAWDLSRYLVHRLLHAVPFLWEFHKVHHSAEVLTPFTVYRVHPVESFLFRLRGALVTGGLTGGFFYAFQGHAVQAEILGVNAIGVLFNATVANLRHSHVWLSFGPLLERVFISPAQHQLHHSRDPADFGVNYGSVLSLWDFLGGSLRLAGRRRALRFGLGDQEQNHHPARALSALGGPFLNLARRFGGTS